jgi:hypothetical protein
MACFLTLWINCYTVLAHPVYVSVANMDIDAQGKCVTVSLKVFVGDMETVLHNKYGIDGWIGTPQEHRDSKRLIGEYLGERFTMKVNRYEEIGWQTDSMVINEEALWIYMKGLSTKPIRQAVISNRLLTDFFQTQTNLLIIHTDGREEGYKLDRKKYQIELIIQGVMQ